MTFLIPITPDFSDIEKQKQNLKHPPKTNKKPPNNLAKTNSSQIKKTPNNTKPQNPKYFSKKKC